MYRSCALQSDLALITIPGQVEIDAGGGGGPSGRQWLRGSVMASGGVRRGYSRGRGSMPRNRPMGGV